MSVTASNATRAYGLSNPVLGGVIAGLENGDNITASYSCGATSASPAGAYPIVPSLADPGERLGNYQVSISNGTMTVLGPVPPVFQTATQSSNMMVLSWAATTGGSYQVQYSGTLAAGDWADLGCATTASNAAVMVTDPVTNGQRFYRVLQVPQ
jgi:hypothetical protein